MTALVHVDAVIVGDDPEAWADAGFAVDDGSAVIGATAIECRSDDSSPRWRLWADDEDLSDDFDGLSTEVAIDARQVANVSHPNRVVEIDHLVLASPDLDRTTEAFASLGVECRRIREIPDSDPAMQQRFFRLGSVIIELVGSVEPTGDGPTSIWGLAFTVDDIDAAAAHLGPACGAPKAAVQPGRRIATVRTKDLGMSLPVALMTAGPPRR